MRTWETSEVQIHTLTQLLNRIETLGGQVFSIFPSERAQHVFVVWSK